MSAPLFKATPGTYDVPNLSDPTLAWLPPRDPLATPASPFDLYRDIPTTVTTDWEPTAIRTALRSHMLGYFQGSALLVEGVMGDARVQATMRTRTASVLGQPVTHRAAPGDTDGAIRDEWERCFPQTCPAETLTQVLQWGTTLGFAPCEAQWDTTLPIWQPRIKVWHPQYVWFNVITRQYLVSTWDGIRAITPGDGRWMLYSPFGTYRGWINGSVRAIAAPWLVRQQAQRDWARYSEVHGIPILKAIVPAGGDAQMKKKFTDAVSNLGSETTVMLPKGIDGIGYDLGMVEATDRSWEAFQGLMQQCDMSIVLALLGQNLTTEVTEGSQAAARVHGDVRQDIVEHDASTLSEFIYQQLARPWALWNYGDAELAPRSTWDVTPPEDFTATSQAMMQLGNAIKVMGETGIPLDIARLFDHYGVPLTDAPNASALYLAAAAEARKPPPAAPMGEFP